MNLDENKAYEDFTTIAKTLEQTKKDYNGLHKILLRYGVVQLILCMLSIVLGSFLKNHTAFGFISLFLDIMAAIYMMSVYFRIYNTENITSNKYYLSCLSTWGIMAVSLPFLNLAVRWIVFTVSPQNVIQLLPKMEEYTMLINILLFCFCFIICSFITNKKSLIILSLIILFLFIILDMLYYNSNISELGSSILTIFYYACITIGYIALSYTLQRSHKNGY